MKAAPKTDRREFLVVAAFTALVLLPFLGKAFHNDEPFFLAAGRQVLSDPFHPWDAPYTWFGSAKTLSHINTTPPVLPYLIAAAYKISGGGEWGMRLVFLPLPILAGLALYGLAGRFLKKPLLPALIVIACPAFVINMNYLMPEAPAVAFGFAGLYAFIRGVDDDQPAWYWGSAFLLGLAIISKYVAVVLLLPVLVYSLKRRVGLGKFVVHGALVVAPFIGLMILDQATGSAFVRRAWEVTAESTSGWWSGWAHKSRSFLAFTGGCGVVTFFWPYWLILRRGRWWAGLVLAAMTVLFLPVFDVGPEVRLIDRATGVALASGGLISYLVVALAGSKRGGWALWASWILSAAMIQVLLYWSVMARVFVFLVPPLVFAMAERFEAEKTKGLRTLYAASLAGTLLLSLALGAVDYRYAGAQKDFASRISSEYLARGRRVWFTGYMGLQHYLEGAGALGLDRDRGGWALAKPGDIVVVLKINSVPIMPSRPIKANVYTNVVSHPIPLRLISGWTGEGGFYSNIWGFLPFSISAEPLEEFKVVELL